MKSIRKSTESTLRERGSKFYGFLFPCSSSLVFDEKLTELKKRYSDATHHCTAYRVLESELREFSNDDGEPSGSAGLPILNSLKSFDLVNCGAVIVRYYGGTKLGKAGLIEAYGDSTKGCIKEAEILQIQKMGKVQITYQYHQEKEIQFLVRTFQLIEEHSEFSEKVSKLFLCPIEQEGQLINSLEELEYLGIEFDKVGHTLVMN